MKKKEPPLTEREKWIIGFSLIIILVIGFKAWEYKDEADHWQEKSEEVLDFIFWGKSTYWDQPEFKLRRELKGWVYYNDPNKTNFSCLSDDQTYYLTMGPTDDGWH